MISFFSSIVICCSLSSLIIFYLSSLILEISSSRIYPSWVTKKLLAYFLKAIDSEATKSSVSFIPTRMGDPLVQVHILLGYLLSIMTIPHCDLSELYLMIV